MAKRKNEGLTGAVQKDELSYLLANIAGRDDLLDCCKSLGVVFKGMRDTHVPQVDMANRLAEHFFDEQDIKAAQKIGDILDQAAASILSSGPEPGSDIGSFKKAIRSFSEKEAYACVWRICRGRGKGHLFGKKHITAVRNIISTTRQRQRDKNVRCIEEECESLRAETGRLKAELATLEHKHKKQGKRLQESEEEIKRFSQKIAALEKAAKQAVQEKKIAANTVDRIRGTTPMAEQNLRLSGELEREREDRQALQEEVSRLRKQLAEGKKHLKRVGVFVDVQNLVITAQKELNGRLDFSAVWKKVSSEGACVKDRVITDAVAYLAVDPLNEDKALQKNIEQAGFTLKKKPITYMSDGSAKGNWDLGMALEAAKRSNRLDIIVLGTGDGDFVHLIDYLKKNNPDVVVEILCFPNAHSTNDMLKQSGCTLLGLSAKELIR